MFTGLDLDDDIPNWFDILPKYPAWDSEYCPHGCVASPWNPRFFKSQQCQYRFLLITTCMHSTFSGNAVSWRPSKILISFKECSVNLSHWNISKSFIIHSKSFRQIKIHISWSIHLPLQIRQSHHVQTDLKESEKRLNNQTKEYRFTHW